MAVNTARIDAIRTRIAAAERKIAGLEDDMKDLRDVAAQFKLLVSLALGGGMLSVLTLLITLIRLVQ